MFAALSTIGGNIYVYVEKYICDTVLYLLSILAHVYDIIINRSAGAPCHVQDIVDVLNFTDEQFIYILMKNLQVPGSKWYEDHVTIHTTTQKEDITLENDFRKHLPNIPTRIVLLIRESIKNMIVNRIGVIVSIMFKILLMFTTQILKWVYSTYFPAFYFVAHTPNSMEFLV